MFKKTFSFLAQYKSVIYAKNTFCYWRLLYYTLCRMQENHYGEWPRIGIKSGQYDRYIEFRGPYDDVHYQLSDATNGKPIYTSRNSYVLTQGLDDSRFYINSGPALSAYSNSNGQLLWNVPNPAFEGPIKTNYDSTYSFRYASFKRTATDLLLYSTVFRANLFGCYSCDSLVSASLYFLDPVTGKLNKKFDLIKAMQNTSTIANKFIYIQNYTAW